MTSEQLLARRALKLARDLLSIAEQAMPESYLATDSRVAHARETIERLTKKRKPTATCPTGFAVTVHEAGVCLCSGRNARWRNG